jgi:predicted metal-binding protein
MTEIKFNPKILSNYFDYAVCEECRSCKRYSFKNCCPPKIPKTEYYQELLPTYKFAKLVYEYFSIDDLNNWKQLGIVSSNTIHEYLLKERAKLLSKGYIFNLALTAGSCKLCDRCSSQCLHPDKMLVPIEGTGINVVKLMKRFKIDINFPVENQKRFIRVGAILWK